MRARSAANGRHSRTSVLSAFLIGPVASAGPIRKAEALRQRMDETGDAAGSYAEFLTGDECSGDETLLEAATGFLPEAA